ncbi:MAG TPA: hypothetical protein VJ672_16280 [Gemmatimonadaceae bacterium]|nr:hypothetical protein [Gemmatimonadaceae bacterium]
MNRLSLFTHSYGALRCAFVGTALIVAASTATAQVSGPPSIMQPKEAAQRAAGKVATHTNTMQAPQDAPAKPAAPAAGASSVNTPARTTAGAAQGTRTPAVPANARASRDTARSVVSTSVAKRGGRAEIALSREVFAYETGGRRDPFLSLITSGELRPMISDLKLVTVIYDATGRSVAILRDVSTKQQYRVKVGQELGRMRVASIQPKSVTFTVDEFGFNRQEVLALGDPLKERTQ